MSSSEPGVPTAIFEEHRGRLLAVAVRMLGSRHDAEDAVQQAWLKTSQADLGAVVNVAGWLTTVVSRECLDLLRSRRRRAEVSWETSGVVDWSSNTTEFNDSVGAAMLVVLDRLSPAQRVALVLHDVFGVPFADVATALNTTPAAAKQLASRARRAVHRGPPPTPAGREHLRLAEVFLAAARDGDIASLLAVLAPDVVRRVDRVLVPAHVATEVHGARAVAEETRVFAERARAGAVVLIDGAPGIAIAADGRLRILIKLTIRADRITAVDIVGTPEALSAPQLTLVDWSSSGPLAGIPFYPR